MVPSDVSTEGDGVTGQDPMGTLEDMKAQLVLACTASDDGSKKPSLQAIQSLVQKLEDQAELVGIGQSSASSGLLAGEWYDKIEKLYVFIVGKSVVLVIRLCWLCDARR